jgi:hypothetical protein
MTKIEKENIKPVCPHCEKEVKKLIEVSRNWFAVNRVFCCPHCHKIVGRTVGDDPSPGTPLLFSGRRNESRLDYFFAKSILGMGHWRR